MPFDLDYTLEEVKAQLQKPASSKVSRQLPTATVELVSNAYDRKGGYLQLDVQGFAPEEHEHLSGAFYAGLQAKQRLDQLALQVRREINPAGTEAGDILADAAIKARIAPSQTKAAEALFLTSQDLLRFGVTGWPEGELRHKGQPLGFASAPAVLLGKRREGLSEDCLGYLMATPFWLMGCIAILEVSSGGTWPKAEEQWVRAEEQVSTAVADFLQWATGENRNRPFLALARLAP